jgi:hypothetical protein
MSDREDAQMWLERYVDLGKSDDTLRQCFIAAIRAERAACAQVADTLAWSNKNTAMLGPELNSSKIAALIRGRSEL